jgi:hypothetical protein
MKKSIVLLLLLSGLVLSCGTGPKPEAVSLAPGPTEPETTFIPPEPTVEEVALAPQEKPVEVPVEKPAEIAIAKPVEVPVVKEFDPNSVSKAMYQAAKLDITYLIIKLNYIIKAKDYNEWVKHLSDSYFQEISDKDFLEEKTEELYRRDQIVAQNTGRDPNAVEKVVLRTAKDYFDHVVVPSRANDRLDDISFLSEDRVRAYTIDDRRGQRLILYDLALINHNWLIVN